MKILCIGRGYIGRALAAFDGFEVLSHQEVLSHPERLAAYKGVVNCAGIVGHRKCQDAGYTAVIDANVRLPQHLHQLCQHKNIAFLQLSTVGISKKQVALRSTERVSEEMSVYPHNLYCASKLLSEVTLKETACVLFRLPWVVVPGVFESRFKNWDAVQDTHTSLLEISDLAAAILAVVKRFHSYCPVAPGVYHLKSRDVYFPEFVAAVLGMELPARQTYPADMTAAVPMETCRAAAAGVTETKQGAAAALTRVPENPWDEIKSQGNM